ncbi:MAG: hypothetical protein JWP01_2050 [Myxococcales bacterium]|nr:hypothetical protein [Myxococcales bacterium]
MSVAVRSNAMAGRTPRDEATTANDGDLAPYEAARPTEAMAPLDLARLIHEVAGAASEPEIEVSVDGASAPPVEVSPAATQPAAEDVEVPRVSARRPPAPAGRGALWLVIGLVLAAVAIAVLVQL